MILLADTNIIIDYWKPESREVHETLNKVFDSNDIIIPGIMSTEHMA